MTLRAGHAGFQPLASSGDHHRASKGSAPTTTKNVLVDTGLHPAHIDHPSHSFGLGMADITHVVNTHLHPDHCGGNFRFPHAEIIVQWEHYQETLAHPEIADELFHRPELHHRLVDGDEQLFSRVRAIVVPGPARGLQALLVSLPHSGGILIAVDAIDTAEHLERDLWTHYPDPDGTGKRATAAADRRTGGCTPPLRTRRRAVADPPAPIWLLRRAGRRPTRRVSRPRELCVPPRP
jgi:glyoxylase-like metal-dependent hydrolase (beta-lactamase superfamily II)